MPSIVSSMMDNFSERTTCAEQHDPLYMEGMEQYYTI